MRRAGVATIVALALLQVAHAGQGPEPFGLTAYVAPEGPLWVRWRTLQAEINADRQVLAACRAAPAECGSPAAVRFLSIVDEARTRNGRAKLGGINRAINLAIRWSDDVAQHRTGELWMAPLTALASGRGDCMDFAIAKYAALRDADVSAHDLRIMIGWDVAARNYHALVTARQEERWFILDSRSMAIVEDVALPNYIPLFSINDDGVKQFHPSSPPEGFKLRDRLSESGCLVSPD